MRRRLSIRSRAPKASSAVVRRVMQANTGRTTAPERTLRTMLHCMGLRYRVDARPEPSLRCSADLVFRQSKVCVFVDGCYWHGCSEHFAVPKRNAAWWAEKIADNCRRDVKRTAELKALGWIVIRLWEHDLLADAVAFAAATRIARIIRLRASRRIARVVAMTPGGRSTRRSADYGRRRTA